MTETRYKIRLWNWDSENECYSVDTEVFTDRDAAERCFNAYGATAPLPYIQFLQEKIANGCVIDEVEIKERKRQEATVFDAITKDAATLAGLLRSLPVLEAPWDAEFQKRYCSKCIRADCDDRDECPYQEFRNNPEWWLALDAAGADL